MRCMPERAGLQWDSEKFGAKKRPKSALRIENAKLLVRARSARASRAELAIQVTTSAGVEFVKTGDGAHNPLRIN